jgi:hypothetical protein
MRSRNEFVVVSVAAFVMLPLMALAQKGDLTHGAPAVQDAQVDFGVLATAPLGDGCATTGVGGPTDPCSYKLHHLTPEEVTVFKGGQVSFQIQGGGHGMAIYEVSKNTTRDKLGQFLCPGVDPGGLSHPSLHVCNGTTPVGATNAAANHIIGDGKGDVVIISGQNVTNAFPDNQVWFEPGRLMSANLSAPPFLPNGELITYRFLKTGRYLVICMNRSHLLNDWMFGFVNVVGGGGNDN